MLWLALALMIELPLEYPEVFDRLGVEPPKGVLLSVSALGGTRAGTLVVGSAGGVSAVTFAATRR